MSYLPSVRKQFAYYRQLGDRTFAQLSDEQLSWTPDPESNSIATIVQHLHGNMLSRWTDFLTTDGEKEWRQRDREFLPPPTDRTTILQRWNDGWDCLENALAPLTENDLERTVRIRNQSHTVIEAVNRQLSHCPYHVGQIVFLGKMQRGAEWTSLSIPKGNSAAYNKKKLTRKDGGHFTDEWTK